MEIKLQPQGEDDRSRNINDNFDELTDEQYDLNDSLEQQQERRRALFHRDPVRQAEMEPYLRQPNQRYTNVLKTLDNFGYDWWVVAVAAVGFFTGSYCLFNTNTVMPSILFVYYSNPDDRDLAKLFNFWVNMITLIGSLIGQITFGILADRMGRASIYGFELAIVLFSTLGLVISADGVGPYQNTSLKFDGLFYFWRLIMGIGIGAEYPLTSVLTAEWASYRHRSRMLATVFLMQPVGQLLAALAGLAGVSIVHTIFPLNKDFDTCTRCDANAKKQLDIQRLEAQRWVDTIWRGVVGFGGLLAMIAIVFRIFLPDPGRYTWEVRGNLDRAVEQTVEWQRKRLEHRNRRQKNASTNTETSIDQQDRNEGPFIEGGTDIAGRAGHARDGHQDPGPTEDTFLNYCRFLRMYLYGSKNWPLLFGTCTCWFLLDLGFYGLGMNTSPILALVWAEQSENSNKTPPTWNADLANQQFTIYEVLMENAKRSIVTNLIGSLVGSILLLIFIDRIHRKKFLAKSFLVVAAFLIATGVSVWQGFNTNWGKYVNIVLYALCHVLFNLGPNTLTFIIPAEIFPTRIRCTLYGLSAASGKLGSIIIQIVVHKVVLSSEWNDRPKKLFEVITAVAIIMMLGCPIAWICIPNVQKWEDNPDDRKKRVRVNKTLEELAPGVWGAREDGQIIGEQWVKKIRRRFAKS